MSPLRNIAIIGVSIKWAIQWTKHVHILKPHLGGKIHLQSPKSQAPATFISLPSSTNHEQPTPTLGSYILNSLLRTPNFNITIITRSTSLSTFPPHSSQTIIKIPDTYPEPELIAALTNQDALVINLPVSLTATTQLKIIDCAVKAGVKRIIPSDFAGCVPLEKTQELDFMTRDNVTVVKYLKDKEREGMTWSAIKCGLYID
jgi:hypothetical protein